MASAASTAAAAAPADDKAHKIRPEKPDEAKYKEDLAAAEKEHSAAQEKLVIFDPAPRYDLETTCTRWKSAV